MERFCRIQLIQLPQGYPCKRPKTWASLQREKRLGVFASKRANHTESVLRFAYSIKWMPPGFTVRSAQAGRMRFFVAVLFALFGEVEPVARVPPFAGPCQGAHLNEVP